MADWSAALDKLLRDIELPVLSGAARCRTRRRSIGPQANTWRSPSNAISKPKPQGRSITLMTLAPTLRRSALRVS